MAGVPILHPQLRVEAVGFRACEAGVVGVLVTPWFMNLMLFPANQETPPPIGSTVEHQFPSGRYGFTAAEEPGLGHYQICSLFSPMFEFPDHATAALTAEEALAELFGAPAERLPATPPGADHPNLSRRQWLRGLLGTAP